MSDEVEFRPGMRVRVTEWGGLEGTVIDECQPDRHLSVLWNVMLDSRKPWIDTLAQEVLEPVRDDRHR